MPPRWITLTIIALWLAATGWMAYRDVWPRLRPNQPPHFNIDLTEEVGGQRINWDVFQKGELIGFAETQVKRCPDRTFDLRSTFRFDNLTFLHVVKLRKVESSYHVTGGGELLALSTKVYWTLAGEQEHRVKIEPNIVGIEGKVENGWFVPRLEVPFAPELSQNPLLKLDPVKVSREGSVLNPMHPLNKLTGLYEGQTWRIPLVDPLSGLAAANALGSGPSLRYLNAEVSAADLEWKELVHKEWEVTDVPCWRIDYAESGKRPCARTWVRQRDGLVLQQEATHEGLDMILKRELRKSNTP
jgi:hypothetical protein